MKSIIKIVTVLALLAGVAAGVALWHGHRTGSTAKVGEAQINDIRDMVKLCTLEIVDEVALLSISPFLFFFRYISNVYVCLRGLAILKPLLIV